MADRFIGDFPYVDFFFMRGDHPSKWERILRSDLATRAAAHGEAAVFVSVQNFESPVAVEADTPERHYAPPYADFDSDDLAASQADMLKLVRFCQDDLDLDDDEIQVWFSGKKGFHVVLSPVAFGVVPSSDLTYIYKRMFAHLKVYLDLPTLDVSVYSKRRMWRIPGTLHTGSGLFKTPLDHDQITETIDAIKALATEPTALPEGDFARREVERAVEFLARFKAEYLEAATAAAVVPVRLHPEAAPGDPVCVTDVMTNGLRKPGDRNRASIVLGSYYKDVGRDERLAITDITDWALRLPPEHRRSDDRYIKANTESTVKAVYEGAGYHFACKFIRSLSGPKPTDGSKRDSIACMGDDCPFIREAEPPTTEIPMIHLSQIGDIAFIDKPVRVQIRAAGTTESPFVVPSKVRVYAFADDCDRGGCVLHASGGEMTLDFSKDLRVLISLCNVTDNQRKTIIREVVTVSSCKRFGYEVLDVVAMKEIAAIPMAHRVVGDRSRVVEGEYAFKEMYVMSDLGLKVNKYYEVVGRTYSHPKTQRATMVVTEATPLKDQIEDFDLEDAKSSFKIFTDAPDTKALLGHMVADLARNVCKVGGRNFALLAVLMTIHSPLSLEIEGELYGGWMNTLLVGDTGEAKSQLVERLMRHIGLGVMSSAQTATRTGLLYAIVNGETSPYIKWGTVVLEDRGLLAIDEASGMSKDEYAELRNARREGVFTVERVAMGEANTRTRIIMLSNPAYGRDMAYYPNGIQAPLDLFQDPDIRRFDLVAGFKAGEVKQSTIRRAMATEVPHYFTPEVVRANVLWAWSRQPEDIYWHPNTLSKIKEIAKRLNDKYSGSRIHLLSQDAVEKIARMTQAVAAMLHSSDDLHITLRVNPEHAEIVEWIISHLYSKEEDLEYDVYVERNSEPEGTDYDGMAFDLERSMETIGVDVAEFYRLFQTNPRVLPAMIEAMAGEAKMSKSIQRLAMKAELIRNAKGGGYEATSKLNKLMREVRKKAGE